MVFEIIAASSAGPNTDAVLVSVPAGARLRIHAIHLSVPDTQTAHVELGTTVVAATNASLNLPIGMGGIYTGGDGEDLTLTSSAAVSYTILYNTEAT